MFVDIACIFITVKSVVLTKGLNAIRFILLFVPEPHFALTRANMELYLTIHSTPLLGSLGQKIPLIIYF